MSSPAVEAAVSAAKVCSLPAQPARPGRRRRGGRMLSELSLTAVCDRAISYRKPTYDAESRDWLGRKIVVAGARRPAINFFAV